MSKICRFTVPASRDVEAILDYIAEQSSIDRAEEFLRQINAKCRAMLISGVWREKKEGRILLDETR